MKQLRSVLVTFIILSSAAMVTLAVAAPPQKRDCTTHPWPYRNTLLPGEALRPGESLESSKAVLSFDNSTGDLVLATKPEGTVLWKSGTASQGAAMLALGRDGNLYIQSNEGKKLWESGTHNASILVIEDNCRMSLYATPPVEDKVWSSNTPMCITAHITMHSHDDVGWILTPEQYSDGCGVMGGGTQNIFTNMMNALADGPSRKFSEVEMYFFERWWAVQGEGMRNLTRKVVERGQLHFVNAGWSMHDEACVHQEAAISNMEAGAQFLRDTFGETFNLTIGWHIDPFGHASTTPRIMSQMGFDAFFFWRTDYQHREYMMKKKTVESMWNPSPSLGSSVQMFTSIMFDSYCMGCNNAAGWYMCPSPFFSFRCEQPTPWDKASSTEQIQDYFNAFRMSRRRQHHPRPPQQQQEGREGPPEDPPFMMATQSTKQMAYDYVIYIREYAEYFRTGHVLVPWGCDFQHEDAHVSFQLMDAVIQEVNSNASHYGMTMQYSHPIDYVQAVQEMNYAWPRNDHDYFIDSDNGHSYWSGFFSSRAEFKGYERYLMNERVGIELALSSWKLPNTTVLQEQLQRINVLRDALGVAQHHDAITGTERVNVRNQYQFLMDRGVVEANKAFAYVLEAATGLETADCPLANLSHCPQTDPLQPSESIIGGGEKEGKNVSALLFNPLSRSRVEYITIPVPVSTITVVRIDPTTTNNQTVVTSEVTPTWALTTTEDKTSPQGIDHQPFQVTFLSELGPLSLVEYVLVPSTDPSHSFFVEPQPVCTGGAVANYSIANEEYNITFDGVTGMVASMANMVTKQRTPFAENILRYCPHANYSLHNISSQASGAYIFRTCEAYEEPTPYAPVATGVTLLKGPLCEEVRQYLNNESNIQQSWRVCRGMDFVELTSGIGEVEMGNNGTEVIIRLQTNVQSGGYWYTDSEALEMQPRRRDHRPNYPYTVTEPIASNYFPCNAFTFMNDTTGAHPAANLVVVADRSRATASLSDGSLEFLVQRRLMYDDNRGVNQNLNETTRVLTTSRILFSAEHLTSSMRFNSLLLTHKPLVRFAVDGRHQSSNHGLQQPVVEEVNKVQNKENIPSGSLLYGANISLPPNIHLHTRTILRDGLLMVRLQHLFAVDEPGSKGMATVERVDLFSLLPHGAMKPLGVEEYDMNGITPLDAISRLPFQTCHPETGESTPVPPRMAPSIIDGSTTVILHPMDIRTYLVHFEWV